MPTSIVGNWEIDGQNLPQQSWRDKYSKWTFTVNTDDTYSLKYIEKGGAITDFIGKVVVWASDVKHSNGTFIQYITINVTHINGQPLPGGWKGIHAFEAGNILKLNIEPNVGGIDGPTPKAGFGSGSGGNNSIYNFVKK